MHFAISLRRLRIIAAFPPAVWLAIALCGCASSRPAGTETRRPFNFQTDTFAYANDLVWEYHFDEHGKWVSNPRHPKPDYTHHCFVVARSARQFFEHARFDPSQPVADADTYRRLIHRVISTSASRSLADSDKVVIPGYADLHAFSQAQAPLLKSECGGAWHSYFQHGHWRMMLPFSRHHQERMSEQLLAELKQDRPPVVHLVRFPQLTINHAVVLFDATETEKEIRFAAYDPNNPKVPVPLVYDRASRTFQFPANDYYPGGQVNVYEVYHDWRY
ncbi:MAG TPA: hypothetical protein VFC07_15910 [Verrucomicrobiae bacterium]|nr:hypothetical protein [Verrucomicrobiae bacterium]